MRRNRFFAVLLLSGALFLLCLFMLFRKQHQRELSGSRTDTIDFSDLGMTSEEELQAALPEQAAIKTEKQTESEMINDAAQPPEQETVEQETVEYDADAAFYSTALTEEIKARITGKSYPDTGEPIQVSYDVLAYVHILHYDFQAQVQEGEIICNQAIAQDLVDIFRELYEHQYPIEKVRLIDEYNADDELSMADNNTSCFNYRTVPGKKKLSNHSYGRAIDVNPLYNPYVRTKDGKMLVSPHNAGEYADRSADFPYKIDREDLCYRLFIEHGFEWGGAWNSSKDYQHFEKMQQEAEG
ncbi:MAG: M15 family metallopeptidase [Lachnospiraceae bacterium]|nr:M15 family metallopeptidase [Lachnospiraceae bacterium]